MVLCPAGPAGRHTGDRVVAYLGAGTCGMRNAPALAEEPGVGADGKEDHDREDPGQRRSEATETEEEYRWWWW